MQAGRLRSNTRFAPARRRCAREQGAVIGAKFDSDQALGIGGAKALACGTDTKGIGRGPAGRAEQHGKKSAKAAAGGADNLNKQAIPARAGTILNGEF
jgi:hypothetical protein